VLYIVLAIVVIIIAWVIGTYNNFVALRARVKNSWAQIDVQLRMRYDLIPNMVETVKGYATHEKEVFSQVSEARSRAMSVTSVSGKEAAEASLTGAIRSLFAVAEAYPELRANENFQTLQMQLQEVEKKLAFSRQFYNDTVMKLNAKVETFPANVVANAFHFEQEPYFQAGEESQGPVQVKF
jgi:LemA protein